VLNTRMKGQPDHKKTKKSEEDGERICNRWQGSPSWQRKKELISASGSGISRRRQKRNVHPIKELELEGEKTIDGSSTRARTGREEAFLGRPPPPSAKKRKLARDARRRRLPPYAREEETRKRTHGAAACPSTPANIIGGQNSRRRPQKKKAAPDWQKAASSDASKKKGVLSRCAAEKDPVAQTQSSRSCRMRIVDAQTGIIAVHTPATNTTSKGEHWEDSRQGRCHVGDAGRKTRVSGGMSTKLVRLRIRKAN